MFRKLFGSALPAGLAAGALAAVLHILLTVPLVIEAETYEGGHHAHPHASQSLALAEESLLRLAHDHNHGNSHNDNRGHDHGHDHGHEQGGWMPEDGLERTLFTVLSAMIAFVGFALLLTAAMVLRGERVSPLHGLVWGMAGFAVFALAPAVGLPAKLPGMIANEVPVRQVWWAVTAAATAGGLWLLAFASNRWVGIIGAVVLIAAPHVVGVPHADMVWGTPPPELAAQFAARSLAVAAVCWAVLGVLAARLLGPGDLKTP